MSTVQDIIDYAERKFPDHGETTANMIKDLNDIHKEVFIKISKFKNTRGIWSFDTAEDAITEEVLPHYDLDTNMELDDIITVKVSTVTTPTSEEDYETYEYAGLLDYVDDGTYFYDAGVNPDSGVKKIGLVKDGSPPDAAGYDVRVYYYKRPVTLTSATDTPNLHTDYHAILKYLLVQSLASQGHSMDNEIANYYQKKADEFLNAIAEETEERYNQTPNSDGQSEEWW